MEELAIENFQRARYYHRIYTSSSDLRNVGGSRRSHEKLWAANRERNKLILLKSDHARVSTFAVRELLPLYLKPSRERKGTWIAQKSHRHEYGLAHLWIQLHHDSTTALLHQLNIWYDRTILLPERYRLWSPRIGILGSFSIE